MSFDGDDEFELRVDPVKDKTALIKDNCNGYGSFNNPISENRMPFKKKEKVCLCQVAKCCGCHTNPRTDEKVVCGDCCTHKISEQDTDAYGSITFVGFERTTHARYVRLSNSTDPAEVAKFMMSQWQFGEKSQLLISIIGSAKAYSAKSDFEKKFKKGLRKVSRMTNALVFTGGTNFGIMKVVGNALRDVSQLDSTSSAYAQSRAVRCIGIVPWGVVPKSAELVKPYEENKVKFNIKLPKQRFLDQNHTHFLMVDDGSKNKFYTEIDFKHALEKYIIDNGVPGKAGEMRRIVGVKLVVGGGPDTIDNVKASVGNKMPVIIFKGTGFAAELFIFAYDLKPLENCNLRDLEQHQKLVELIGETFPDFTIAKRIKCYETIMQCMLYKDHITLASFDDGTKLDQMILNAFLQVYKASEATRTNDANSSSISNQLKLAIHWGCCDYVELLLKEFDDDLKGLKKDAVDTNIDIIVDNLLHAISISRHDEARVLLEYTLDYYKGDLKGVITEDKILWLYQKKYKKKKINILHLLTDTEKKLTFQDVQEDFLKSLKSFGDIDNKDFEDDVYMQLFFYAVLSNMKYMTVLFLHYGGQTLAKILMANKLYGNIKDFYQNNKNTEEKTLVFRLNRNEQYFESLALSMLNEYSQEQELFTRRVLCQELENYGSKSCLALAASTDHIDFVAHDTCQIMLTENTWCGRIVLKGDSWLIHGLQVVSCLVPPLFLLLEYKTREMEKVEGKAKIYYESNQLRSQLKSYRQEKETYSDKTKETLSRVYYKGRYFYESPITKCAVNVVSYFIFLGFFAFVLTHKLEKKIKFSEWIVGLYIIAFIFEEFRQIVQAPVGRTLTQKLKNYFSSFLNILDVIALTFFIVAFILRSYTDKLIETRLLYAADIFFWIIRLLSVFSISPELGPYVEMIRRMIVDLLYFVFVLAVFLLAYGIARFAILSPMNDSTVRAVTAIFSVPYKQMYADSLDEIVMKAPSGLTVFNMDYSTLVIPIAKILMAGYTLLAAVLLLNLLIARFSYIYDGVQGDSRKIWKFNRYFTMQEYQNRSAVPLPFSLFPNIHVLATTFLNSKCLSRPKKSSDFTIDEQDELFGFERECLITCLSEEGEQKQIRKQEKEQKKNRERLEKKEKIDKLHPELTSRLNLIEDQLKGMIMKEPEGDTRKRLASACDFHTTLKADVHYPLTDTKREFVNEENIPWEVEFEDYEPNTPKTFFPSNDTDSDHQRNPRGRTGVAGKGLLKTFGPNEIVETLLTRWKPGLTGIEIGSSGLKILQVLVVKETKSGTINIPIGPVTKCESHRQEELIPPILSALFHVGVLSDKGLWLDDKRKNSYAERCQEILSHGLELYNGPIEDPRNTDEAWIESVVINYHDQDGRVISKYLESKLASQLNLEWMDVSTRIPLGWRYIDYLKKIAMHCNAQF